MVVEAPALFQAIVVSSDAPLMLLDDHLTIIAASASFCEAFRIDPGTVEGRSIFQLGSGEWELPKLRSLLSAVASSEARIDPYELDMKRQGEDVRRLVIRAQKLFYDNADAVRLMVTVSDVTDARLAEKVKDDLLKEKAFLLKEVQHRVANSLQIIASVLMQSARNVQSEESRSHLRDAHSRVMSMANVQKQLSSSQGDDVELQAYFNLLCQSLGASMIRDHGKQSIKVSVDDSRVVADVSISLGLIVTELVINALKHAFTPEGDGEIVVNYRSREMDWTLSVSDDGVGMPPDSARATPGLGTSIVEALARQLQAEIQVAKGHPGTVVSIIHEHRAAAGGPLKPVSLAV
jgi:two-component sensor histidine kinase